MVYMRHLIIGLFAVLAACVCFSGCIQTPDGVEKPVVTLSPTPGNGITPSETTEEIPLSFEEEIAMVQKKTDSKPPVELKIGQTSSVSLQENPTTGYSWNVSVTEGLKIVSDEFIGPGNKQVVGAGGKHVWTIQATGIGDQTFSGVYRRPWEPPAENDTTYTEHIIVTR